MTRAFWATAMPMWPPIDALLGAAGLGDIGSHFPDTDPAYKGIYSIQLLEHTASLLKKEGWSVGNVDLIIVAQKPKLLPHFPAMREKLAQALEIGPEQVNIKGKTEETLGFTGRMEGMKAYAVALLLGE